MSEAAYDDWEIDDELRRELVAQPHDAYFKRVFADVGRAASLFRSHLPPALVRAADWSRLALVPASFVKRTLQQTHSDLLFTVPVGACSVLVHLLFEHQTSVDRAMPLRLLTYATEIWQAWLAENGAPLPPVLPLVLHQGPDRWTVSTQFSDLLAMPDGEPGRELAELVPSFRHLLLDLTQTQPHEDEPDERLRMVLHLMKLARQDQQLLAFFEWLAQQLIDAADPLLRLTLLYALHADQRIDAEAIYLKLHSNEPLRSTAMSLGEKLFTEGRQEGRQEGLLRGRWIGKIQTLQELMGTPPTPDSSFAGRSIEELEHQYQALQREYDGRFKRP